jgi:hypothetical protein
MVVMRERSLIDTHGQALEQGPVVFCPRPADQLATGWNSASAVSGTFLVRTIARRSACGLRQCTAGYR